MNDEEGHAHGKYHGKEHQTVHKSEDEDLAKIDYLREDENIENQRLLSMRNAGNAGVIKGTNVDYYPNNMFYLDTHFQNENDGEHLCNRKDIKLVNNYNEQLELFIVEVTKIGLIDGPNPEPFFGVFSVYRTDEKDLAKAKVTENFYIDIFDSLLPILQCFIYFFFNFSH